MIRRAVIDLAVMEVAKDPEVMTLEELMQEKRSAFQPGTPRNDRINTAIQVRLVERQDTTAGALVTSTQGLVTSTSRLVHATWGLVAATAALVVAEVLLKVFGK